MGMFDNVTVDYPLPDVEFQSSDFQTKDLECMMRHYKIDADGQLWELRGHWKNDPDLETRMKMSWEELQPYYAPENWIEDPPILLDDMHGDIRVIGGSQTGHKEYIIRFTHGRVEWIRSLGT